jgi:hypothetical protein
MFVSWDPPAYLFSHDWYKVYMKWRHGTREKMIEDYRGNSTNYTFSMNNMPFPHVFYVMAYMAGFIQPTRTTARITGNEPIE